MTLNSYSSGASNVYATGAAQAPVNSTNGREIIGDSPALYAVMQEVGLVAPTGSTVLIQGETGTGKELIARAIHDLSPRRNAPFITLNCAAVPATLIESELFGHERGAFTGALTQRLGRFESAHGGTLFLDESGEISLEVQVKLLRVLQEQEFERLGSTRSIRVNVRVVTATNRDLWRMVEENQFRADLFYRLSVFPVSLPPLRERREDTPALVRHFVRQHSERMNKIVDEIPADVMDAMLAYHWPGNVRQLQNFVEHGVIVSRGPEFQPPVAQLRTARTQSAPANPRTLEDAARDHILQTLRETRGVVGRAARRGRSSGACAHHTALEDAPTWHRTLANGSGFSRRRSFRDYGVRHERPTSAARRKK